MAIDAVVIRFSTAGIPEVSAAFARVETQAKKFEDAMTGASEKGGRSRVTAADREAREKIKAYQKVDKEVEKAQRTATRELERDAKRRADIVRRSSEMAGRDAVKAAREEAREIERLEEQKLRAKVQAAKQAAQAAAREAAEEMKAREKVALAGSRYAKTWGSRIGGVASMVGMTAGIGGAFAIADAGRKEFADERVAAQLVNQVTTGAKAPEGANVGNILAQAGAVAKTTGMDRSEIVQAGLVYAQNARRGDFGGAMGNMGFFAKLSKVTGMGMSDLASAAGTLQSQNADLKPEQMQQLLLNAYAQSKQGTMSMVDAAKTMGITGSTRSSFQGDVTENQRQLLGFAQIAKAGGDAGEAGTFVKDIALEASKANAKFMRETKKAGHERQLFKTDEHGRMEGPEQLVLDIFKNTGGNIQQINDLMGIRGGALFRELEGSYIQGAGKKNDVAGGLAAVRSNLREVTGATMTSKDLDAQFAQTMSAPGEKFGLAMTKIQTALEERLAPALEKFADLLSNPKVEENIDKAISAFGAIASYLIDNPLKGIGLVVAAAVTNDIKNAAIGEGIKSVLATILKQPVGGNAPIPNLPGAGGAGGAAPGAAGGLAGGALAGAGAVGMLMNIAGGGPQLKTADQLSSDPKLDPSKGAFWKSLPEAAKAKYEEIKKDPWGFLMGGDPAKSTGLDTLKKQVDDTTKSLQNLDSAAKKATGGVQGIPPVSAGAPAQPIGHDSRAKS